MEFDRMVSGYHRREVAELRRWRLVLTEIRNCMRTEDELVKPEEVMGLPGDGLTPSEPQMSEEDYKAALAADAELDKDLL